MAEVSELDTECESINAIYGDGTLVLDPIATESAARTATLEVPDLDLAVKVTFDADYPTTKPEVSSTSRVGSRYHKGFGQDAVVRANEIVHQAFVPGQPCVFDLVEGLRETMVTSGSDGQEAPPAETSPDTTRTTREPPPVVEWAVSEPIEKHGSVFVGWAVAAASSTQAQQAIESLKAHDKKVARATHNISAWRIRTGTAVVEEAGDDDGEHKAGSKLLQVLSGAGASNVVVVVSRWYGGVQLGPERFRLIAAAGRANLVAGGFLEQKK